MSPDGRSTSPDGHPTSPDRPLSRAVALLALGFAALVLGSPFVADRVPTAAVVERLGNDYLLVAGIAAVALVATLAVLLVRAVSGVAEARPPAVEGTAPRSLGREVDAALDSLPAVRTTDRHRRVHWRLRRAAVRAVAERERCSPRAARDRVERREWTDDADAAAFLATATLEEPPLDRRLRALLAGDHWFRRRVRATVAALESLEGDRT